MAIGLAYRDQPDRPQWSQPPWTAGSLPNVDQVASVWYESIWLWFAIAGLSVAPFLFTPLPPLGDLFEHMGRYHVMLEHGHSVWLDRYYRYRWVLIPNLGQDLLMLPFGTLFGVERGAVILSAAILPASVMAVRSLSRAIHGRVQPLAFLALPFLFDFTYLFGFMNYHTGLVVMLWGVVAWYRTRTWSPVGRAITMAALAMTAWLAHLAAWAILLIGVGSLELVRLPWRDWRQSLPLFVRAAVLMAAMSLPALISIYDMLTIRTIPVAPIARTLAETIQLKLTLASYVLRDEHHVFDIASLAAVILVILALVVSRRVRFDSGMFLFAAILFGLFVITPIALAGGYYADIRLLPVAYMMLLIAARVSWTDGARTALAAVTIGFFAVRIALTTVGWAERGRSLELDLAALDHVPYGARIASAAPRRTCQSWPDNSLEHLPGLAIVRRDAFVSTVWNIPGQQPMQPILPPGTPPSERVFLTYSSCKGTSPARWLSQLRRGNFDFVWMFRDRAPDATRNWLTPVYRGPQGTLYAIDHRLHPQLAQPAASTVAVAPIGHGVRAKA